MPSNNKDSERERKRLYGQERRKRMKQALARFTASDRNLMCALAEIQTCVEDIAKRFGAKKSVISYYLKTRDYPVIYRDNAWAHNKPNLDPLPQDPTPEEIQAACAEIQAGWSEHERRVRAGQVGVVELANQFNMYRRGSTICTRVSARTGVAK